MNTRPLQKWELELNMKVHKTKVKEARNQRKVTKTRNVSRKISSLPLKHYLKLHDLQHIEKVKSIQKLSEQYSCPEDLVELTQRELQTLIDSLHLYPGQFHKFQKMLSSISKDIYAFRSNTAVFPTITPSHFSDHRRDSAGFDSVESSQKLNLQLKSELEAARAKLSLLQSQVSASAKPRLVECEFNTRIDKTVTGKSFDSSRMRSTLHNMDMEEVCRCFARVIENQCKRTAAKVSPMIREVSSVFFEETADDPSEVNVYNWVRSVIFKGKIEKEAVVNGIVYLERYADKSEMTILPQSWKKLTFTALFLASKLGKHYQDNFYQIFDVEQVESMERAFLILIEFNLKIRQSEYAHAYFLLRTFTTEKDKSAPIKFLKVDKVLDLQKAIIPEETIKKTFLKSL
jgi:hypothetical protein